MPYDYKIADNVPASADEVDIFAFAENQFVRREEYNKAWKYIEHLTAKLREAAS